MAINVPPFPKKPLLGFLIAACMTVSGCGSSGSETANGSNMCQDIDAVAGKVYVTFVIHNEEDDAEGVAGSISDIPDYNGDPAVFAHFAEAMIDYATMLSGLGATLSFQPDWTFCEGVQKYRPTFFQELTALPGVEVAPHAHETIVSYDEVYDTLVALGAHPEKILGGLAFENFVNKQSWFDAHPDFRFWGAPTASPGHTDDKPAPPFVYRIPQPKEVAVVEDLYRHVATSPLIVTPGIELEEIEIFEPDGRFITPSYVFEATRFFLAEPTDTSAPPQWRKEPDSTTQQTAGELIAEKRQQIEQEILPLVNQGRVEFRTVGEIIDLYEKYETCMDLTDGQDLSGYVTTDARGP